MRTKPLVVAIWLSSSHSAEELAIGFSMKRMFAGEQALLGHLEMMPEGGGDDDGIEFVSASTAAG